MKKIIYKVKLITSNIYAVIRYILRNIINLNKNYSVNEEFEYIYINLDHRKDRNSEIIKELNKIGINKYKRIAGVNHVNGALGCAMAHKNALNYGKDLNKNLVIIEDDAEFLIDKKNFIFLINKFLNNKSYDVMALGNNPIFKIKINSFFSISTSIHSTSCYVVRRNIINDLINIYSQSIKELENGNDKEISAIDVIWQNYQKKSVFIIPNRKIVLQRASYSDIEKTFVNYGL